MNTNTMTMTMTMNSYTTHRISKFLEQMNNISLEQFWNMLNSETENIVFDVRVEENILFFTIHFKKQFQQRRRERENYKFYPIAELPLDVNRFIASFYNEDNISINIEILFPNNYPFHPPVWKLVNVKSNMSVYLNLNDYYDNIINNHNQCYKRDWSPAIDIEKDLLYFIQKINHFSYFYEE